MTDRLKVRAQLAEQSNEIPVAAQQQVDAFVSVRNRFMVPKLLAAIESFQDPQDGFAIWTDYYRTGDDVALRQRVKAAKIRPGSVARITTVAMAENQAVSGKGNVVSRRIGVLAETALRSTVLKEVDRLDSSLQPIVGIIHATRSWVFPDDPGSEVLLETLHPKLRAAVESKLLHSLAGLKAAGRQPLIDLDPESIEALTKQITTSSQQRFNRLAEQSYPSVRKQQIRQPLNLGYKQAPNRRFGIEIEGHLPTDSPTIQQIFDVTQVLKLLKLPCTLPTGIPKIDSSYQKWSVVMDPSVINPLRVSGNDDTKTRIRRAGVEVVSPILRGQEGARTAQRVLSVLPSLLRTNDSCGFHVHCDLESASLDEIKNLAIAFVKNEAKLDRYVDPSRRGSNASTAASVVNVSLNEIKATKTIGDLIYLVNQGNRNSKFDITNLGNPGAPQTVQYRGEGGPGYLESAFSYTMLLVNFTEEARHNPNLDVDDLVEYLSREHQVNIDVTGLNSSTGDLGFSGRSL